MRGDDAGSECNAIRIPRNFLVYGKTGRGSIGELARGIGSWEGKLALFLSAGMVRAPNPGRVFAAYFEEREEELGVQVL